jgi:hypothetical protein
VLTRTTARRSRLRAALALTSLDERIVPDVAAANSFDTSIIQPAGPRDGGSNTFFNIEGDGNALSFRSYVVADFNFAGKFTGSVTGINAADVKLSQDPASFSKNGTYKVYITGDQATPINSPTGLKYVSATPDGIAATDFADRVQVGTFNFVNSAKGTVDTVTLDFTAPAAQAILVSDLNGDGKIRLLFTPDNAATPAVAATYGGATPRVGVLAPQLTIDAAVDVTAPTAKAGALPPVLVAGGSAYPIQVTYADNTAIKVSTIDGNDIRVTGPGGFNQLASFVSVDVNTDGTPRVATYSLAAPGGVFDMGDNGLYTVALEAGQVTDVGGTAVAAGSLGTFEVAIGLPRTAGSFDTSIIQEAGPRGADQFFNVEGNGNAPQFRSYGVADFNFTDKFGAPVTSFNEVKVTLTQSNASFTTNGDFKVYLTGDTATGINKGASPLVYDSSNVDGIKAGDFDDRLFLGEFSFVQTATGNQDTYTLVISPAAEALLANEINTDGIVRLLFTPDNVDTPGVAATWGGELGATPVLSIDANTAAPGQPTAKAGPLPPVTTSGGTAYTFTVTYTDDTAIDVSTLDGNDVRVTGPGGFDQLATFVSVDVNSDGTPRVATYSVAAPGGSFDPTDNGSYTLMVEPNQVADTSGNFVAPNKLGAFSVAIPTPATFVVLNDFDAGPGSLRQAVLDANANLGEDSITFDPAFFNALTPRTINLVGGELKVADSVQVLGPGADVLTLSGGLVTRVFNINGPGTLDVLLSKLTISQGTAGTAVGGGVLSAGENLTVADCVITGGSALEGGGIAQQSGGKLVIQDSRISTNVATVDGGGVNVDPGVAVTVVRSTISGNTAGDDGGGLYQDGGSLLVEASTISGNFSNTTVGGGGGLYLRGSPTSVVIRNSTISGNASNDDGGGIQLGGTFNGVLTLQNSTVVNNVASGVGGGVGEFSGTSTISLTSTIVALNNNLSGPDIFTDQKVEATNSLIGVSDLGFTLTDLGGNKLGTSGVPLDPQVEGLANNGGPTETHALKAGSPALDAGSNPAALVNDQRGPGFARTSGAATDIGAYELQAAAPPATVSAVVVNDGSAQRSRVTSLKVGFDQVVSFSGAPAAAFQLKRQSDNAVVTLSAAVDNTGPGTLATLTFSGTSAVDFGSLADGRYTLTIDADQVSNANGKLDGDGNGTGGDDYVLVGAPGAAPNLYRLFGDSDGDGDVDASDFGAFRSAFGGSNPTFDFDGDGDVDASDFGAFRQRFGSSV